MSAQQKDKLIDQAFKGFMVIMISICGFFLVRLVTTLDRATADIEVLKIDNAVIKATLKINR